MANRPAPRASGGARATRAKRATQAAARKRKGNFAKEWAERFDALPEMPKDLELAHERVVRGMLLAWRQTEVDPGLAPEKRAHALAALAPQVAKLLDPAKLGAELRELKRAFEELKARKANGGEHAAVDPGGAAPRAPLC